MTSAIRSEFGLGDVWDDANRDPFREPDWDDLGELCNNREAGATRNTDCGPPFDFVCVSGDCYQIQHCTTEMCLPQLDGPWEGEQAWEPVGEDDVETTLTDLSLCGGCL